MKKVLFVHCGYAEHLQWILPVIEFFLKKGMACHLFPTHWDPDSFERLTRLRENPRFKLLRPRHSLHRRAQRIMGMIAEHLPVFGKEKQIAIDTYKGPAFRFLKKGQTVPEASYDARIFQLAYYHKKYRYDGLIAHGIHANPISNFAWHYFRCPKRVCDRGFIKGSVMLDKHCTETDRSELQSVTALPDGLSRKRRQMLQSSPKRLVCGQHDLTFRKPPRGKNLLYALSRMRNSVNLRGCLQGYKEIEIIDALSKHLPTGWNLIVKTRGKYDLQDDTSRLPDTVYIAKGNTDVGYLIDMSDAVISFISKMGLEAAVKEKGVLTMGNAHYSHFGFTRDMNDLGDLPEFLERGTMTVEEKGCFERFCEYYLTDYLIFPWEESIQLKRVFHEFCSGSEGQPNRSPIH